MIAPQSMQGFGLHIYCWFAPGTIDPRVERCFKSAIDYHNLSDYTTVVCKRLDPDKSMHYQHGLFIDQILGENRHDVCVFVDVDFLIVHTDALFDLCRYAYYNKSFAGVAHNVGHIDQPHHIFAGAPLIAISRTGYERIGKPSAIAGLNHDTCQLWSMEAERLKVPYFASYPVGFDWSPIGQFGHYGPIGRGIHYKAGVHLLGGSEESWQTLKASREDAILRFCELTEFLLAGNEQQIQPRWRCNDLSCGAEV